MTKYRKKPVIIEAFQCGEDKEPEWFSKEIQKDNILIMKSCDNIIGYVIKTLEGNMQAFNGDYIIKDIQGEIYPCKPDIFEATYERIE